MQLDSILSLFLKLDWVMAVMTLPIMGIPDPGPHSFNLPALKSIVEQCGRFHWPFTLLWLSLKETFLGVLKDASALSVSGRPWSSMRRGTMTQQGTIAQNASTSSRLGSPTSVSPRLPYFHFCYFEGFLISYISNICEQFISILPTVDMCCV